MIVRVLRLSFAIGALVGFAWIVRFWGSQLRSGAERGAASSGEVPLSDPTGRVFEPLPPGLLDTGAGVGLLLLAGYLAGRLCSRLKLAAVTGYLLLGVLVGPQVLGIIRAEEIGYLTLVNDLAISLIALTAGGEIRLSFLRESWKQVSTIAIVEAGGVLAGCLVLAPLVLSGAGIISDPWTAPSLAIAALVAVIAVANSPAIVVAVINELNARGTVSKLALAVTVCKDLLLVVVFTVTLALAATAVLGADESAGASAVVKDIAVHLGGSLVAGLVVGVVLAYSTRAFRQHLVFFVVFACFAIALGSEALHLEPLIVAIVAGMLMENLFGEVTEELFESIEELSLPVYCVFFGVAGTKLDLVSLADVWPWALVFVAGRAALVWATTTGACLLVETPRSCKQWLWSGFIPQAGIAVALATIVNEQFENEDFAEPLFGFILAIIAVHQLVGPVVFRLGLVLSKDDEPEARTQSGGETQADESRPQVE